MKQRRANSFPSSQNSVVRSARSTRSIRTVFICRLRYVLSWTSRPSTAELQANPRQRQKRESGTEYRYSQTNHRRGTSLSLRYDEIGQRLRVFRLQSGMNVDEIATKIGISRTA